MLSKRLVFSILLLALAFLVFRIAVPDNNPCEANQMLVLKACSPVRSAYNVVYQQLSCFSNRHSDWRQLSHILKQLPFTRNVYGTTYPFNVLGTKNIACFDDELDFDVYDDERVFLFIEQDTSKAAHAGALRQLFIDGVLPERRKIDIVDVGKGHRTIWSKAKQAVIRYQLDYDELDSQTLRHFQAAIHFDSTYQTRFEEVTYQLISQQTHKQEASIAYEEYGTRFYLHIP